MMVADELDVADEATQIFPTWEFARVNHDIRQAAMRFNPRVGRE